MGMLYILRSEDEFYGRTVMHCSANRARTFYEVAKSLEEKLGKSCGLTDYSSMDEFGVDADAFVKFFELFMQQDWRGDGVEYLWNWAEYSAGIVTNITLEPKFWKSRRGPALLPVRYSLFENDLDEELSRRTQEFYKQLTKLPKAHHPEFSQLPLDGFAAIIEQTPITNQNYQTAG